jgi:Cof subfamily protein (haloacid dehalogenase superfamily)
LEREISKADSITATDRENAGPIRLVALDLDGTLLTTRKSISARTHTTLRSAIKRGVQIVLSSARPPRSVRPYYTRLKLQTPQINYNGALIWDEPNKKIIRHTPLDQAVATRIIKFARRKYPALLVSIEILDKWYTDHYSDVPEYATETSRHFMPDFIGPLGAFLHVPITKLMLLGDPRWIAHLEELLPARFDSSVMSHARSDPHLLQIMAPAINKGLALAEVAKSMGIPAAQVMAIGDAPNDLEMLQWAGTSVAVNNAWPQIKSHVNHVTATNDEDGVALAIERFVLPKRRRSLV